MFIWLQLTRTYKGNQKGSSYRGTWFLLTSLITWSLTERTDTFFATGHQGITEKKKLTQSTTDQPLQKYISSLQILFEIWFKINSTLWIDYVLTHEKWGLSYRGKNYRGNDLKGEKKSLRVAGRFKLSKIKLWWMYGENPGKINCGSSKDELFELPGVNFTVCPLLAFRLFVWSHW